MCKVSIIINCLNGEKYLLETLDCVKRQIFQDYEVVFWDNCSTDQTGLIAKSFGDKLRYFRGECTVPLGKAKNLALAEVKGEYIAFLDSDDLWDPQKLLLQVRELDDNPDIGLVCSNYNMYNMMSGKVKRFDKKLEKRKMDFSGFIDHYNYCFSTFMVRRRALGNLEYYFSDHLKYAEEYELFSKISLNWNALYLPEALVTYRIHASMNSMHLNEVQFDEYDEIIRTLRNIEPEIDVDYPEVIRWISFIRDLAGTKDAVKKGDNLKARDLIKPYLDYNFRAKCFYILSFFPSFFRSLLQIGFINVNGKIKYTLSRH